MHGDVFDRRGNGKEVVGIQAIPTCHRLWPDSI